MTPATLKATIEVADRAVARGAPGEALRLLLAALRGPIMPDHDHTCPQCPRSLVPLDEPCDDLAAPMLCGDCEDNLAREYGDGLGFGPEPIDRA